MSLKKLGKALTGILRLIFVGVPIGLFLGVAFWLDWHIMTEQEKAEITRILCLDDMTLDRLLEELSLDQQD